MDEELELAAEIAEAEDAISEEYETLRQALHTEYLDKIAPFQVQYDEQQRTLTLAYRESCAPLDQYYKAKQATLIISCDEKQKKIVADIKAARQGTGR